MMGEARISDTVWLFEVRLPGLNKRKRFYRDRTVKYEIARKGALKYARKKWGKNSVLEFTCLNRRG